MKLIQKWDSYQESPIQKIDRCKPQTVAIPYKEMFDILGLIINYLIINVLLIFFLTKNDGLFLKQSVNSMRAYIFFDYKVIHIPRIALNCI